jgi:hypothetical protein
MEDSIPAERAPAEVGAGVSLIVITVITLLDPLKDIAISTASRLTERRTAITVELIPIVTALYALSYHTITTTSG